MREARFQGTVARVDETLEGRPPAAIARWEILARSCAAMHAKDEVVARESVEIAAHRRQTHAELALSSATVIQRRFVTSASRYACRCAGNSGTVAAIARRSLSRSSAGIVEQLACRLGGDALSGLE